MTKILFGLDINPSAANIDDIFQRAEMADTLGFDLVTSQDHPYNRQFLDTWTMLTMIAARTERVHVGANVFNLPLRPPAMLAKQVASLDVLSNGRVELGLGAGAFWRGIAAYGGTKRTGKEAYQAFKEALHILRGMLDNPNKGFTYEGEFYQVKGAIPGPPTTRRVPIWVGAGGPKMLRLTGAMADGLLISVAYIAPDKLQWFNERVDEGAAEAERDPSEIRRGYNLMGSIQSGVIEGSISEEGIHGDVSFWIDILSRWHEENRQDTFIFWPSGENPYDQIKIFAEEIIPVVRARFA